MGLALITKGMISIETITIINRYVMPYNLQVTAQNELELQIKNRLQLNLNASDILDKNVNLQLTDKDINVNKLDSEDINIKEWGSFNDNWIN